MRKTDFLHKLAKEKKLQVVEPSEEMRIAYLQRAQESLSSAKALLKIGNLKDAVALAYYSSITRCCLCSSAAELNVKTTLLL